MTYDKDKIFIVGYDTNACLVTDDKEEAKRFCAIQKKKYPALAWEVRTIEGALFHAWRVGNEDGFSDGMDVGRGDV